jgi:phage protein D/phage baseplate assembly protein gpV
MQPIAVADRVEIESEGRILQREYLDALTEVRVHSESCLPTQCELSFVDSSPSPLEQGFRLGSSIKIRVGGAGPDLFAGRVTAVEHVFGPSGIRRLRIRAYDLLQTLQRRRPIRGHVRTTLGRLAGELVADLGVQVQATEPGPLWERVIQYNQSDFDLLASLADRCGLQFALRDSTLHLFSGRGTGETVPLTLGDTLFEANVELNGAMTWNDVMASGWDPWHGDSTRVAVDKPRRGYDIAGGLDLGLLPAQGGNVVGGFTSQVEAQTETFAQAQLDRMAATEVTFWGAARGNAQLCPGISVAPEGLSTPMDGTYVLTHVTHTIDGQRGFVSEMSSRPCRRPAVPQGLFTTLGVVTNAQDPESLGRVQASLPALNDVETDWLQVVMAGAGAKKGLTMVPDTGDRVLVLCAQSDPAQGVILGGLYGRGGLPKDALSGRRVVRFSLQSPGGQSLRFDDDQHHLRLENDGGSYLDLAPGKVLLHSATRLEIAAPGQDILIRAKRIDFEKAE